MSTLCQLIVVCTPPPQKKTNHATQAQKNGKTMQVDLRIKTGGQTQLICATYMEFQSLFLPFFMKKD